jgi:hypothetical protein
MAHGYFQSERLMSGLLVVCAISPLGAFMRLLFSGLALLFVVNMAPRSQAAGDDNLSVNRVQSVINTFQVMCTLELPNFEHIDSKATAMRMQLRLDNKVTTPGNTVTHSKAWIGALTNGPFVLLLDEMSGSKGKSTSCAVVGDVPDLDAFRAEAVKAMKLPVAPPPEMGGDGTRSFVWDGSYGSGTTLILRDLKPSGKAAVMLKLLTLDAHR